MVLFSISEGVAATLWSKSTYWREGKTDEIMGYPKISISGLAFLEIARLTCMVFTCTESFFDGFVRSFFQEVGQWIFYFFLTVCF